MEMQIAYGRQIFSAVIFFLAKIGNTVSNKSALEGLTSQQHDGFASRGIYRGTKDIYHPLEKSESIKAQPVRKQRPHHLVPDPGGDTKTRREQ